MSYFEIYKKKLNNSGGSECKSFENSGKDYIIRHFKDDPSYKLATLTDDDLNEGDIDIRVANVDKTSEEKRFVFLPDTIIKQGSYISYEKRNFIIEEVETNSISPVAKARLCNQTLKWKGLEKTIPCFITNDAYGSKILADNTILATTDTKAKLKVQANKYTKQIKRDTRFIFNHSEFDIFRVIDITTSMDEGFIVFIMKKDKLMEEDDLENNIAFNNELPASQLDECKIIGEDIIKINEEYEYQAENITSPEWVIDDKTIATIVSASNNKCTIKGLSQNETFVLSINNTGSGNICEKIITTAR